MQVKQWEHGEDHTPGVQWNAPASNKSILTYKWDVKCNSGSIQYMRHQFILPLWVNVREIRKLNGFCIKSFFCFLSQIIQTYIPILCVHDVIFSVYMFVHVHNAWCQILGYNIIGESVRLYDITVTVFQFHLKLYSMVFLNMF